MFMLGGAFGVHSRRAYDAWTFLGDMGGIFGTIKVAAYAINFLLGNTDTAVVFMTTLFRSIDR